MLHHISQKKTLKIKLQTPVPVNIHQKCPFIEEFGVGTERRIIHFSKNNEYKTVCEGVFMVNIFMAECLCENKQGKEKKTLNLL